MKRFETRLERLDDIERKLTQYPAGLTTGQMANIYQVDPATIHRDLSALERRGTGLIKNGRRWMLDHRRALYSIKLSQYEVVAFFLAARLLSRCSDEQNPHIASALAKLADAVRTRSSRVATHIDEAAIAVATHQSHPAFIEAFEAITTGWLEQRKVQIDYYSYSSGERTQRVFSPYYMEPVGVGFTFYVIGFDELRKEVRTLKLERISNARVTSEHFDAPTDFNARHALASAWGIMWAEGDDIEVHLRFNQRVVRRVKETVWHSSQRIDDLPDGSCLFTVRVGSLLELRPWVRQWGADVEVIEPQELRQELLAEAHALLTMYADAPPPIPNSSP